MYISCVCVSFYIASVNENLYLVHGCSILSVFDRSVDVRATNLQYYYFLGGMF